MAITPYHQHGEATEADLQHAYDKARGIGLFLVEKYAREALREHSDLHEFVIEHGLEDFKRHDGSSFRRYDNLTDYSGSVALSRLWNVLYIGKHLQLTSEPMRFTADGPVRRDW